MVNVAHIQPVFIWFWNVLDLKSFLRPKKHDHLWEVAVGRSHPSSSSVRLPLRYFDFWDSPPLRLWPRRGCSIRRSGYIFSVKFSVAGFEQLSGTVLYMSPLMK